MQGPAPVKRHEGLVEISSFSMRYLIGLFYNHPCWRLYLSTKLNTMSPGSFLARRVNKGYDANKVDTAGSTTRTARYYVIIRCTNEQLVL